MQRENGGAEDKNKPSPVITPSDSRFWPGPTFRCETLGILDQNRDVFQHNGECVTLIALYFKPRSEHFNLFLTIWKLPLTTLKKTEKPDVLPIQHLRVPTTAAQGMGPTRVHMDSNAWEGIICSNQTLGSRTESWPPFMILQKLPNFLVPQFPHLFSGDMDSTQVAGWQHACAHMEHVGRGLGHTCFLLFTFLMLMTGWWWWWWWCFVIGSVSKIYSCSFHH